MSREEKFQDARFPTDREALEKQVLAIQSTQITQANYEPLTAENIKELSDEWLQDILTTNLMRSDEQRRYSLKKGDVLGSTAPVPKNFNFMGTGSSDQELQKLLSKWIGLEDSEIGLGCWKREDAGDKFAVLVWLAVEVDHPDAKRFREVFKEAACEAHLSFTTQSPEQFRDLVNHYQRAAKIQQVDASLASPAAPVDPPKVVVTSTARFVGNVPRLSFGSGSLPGPNNEAPLDPNKS